jgi:hypothetical protein
MENAFTLIICVHLCCLCMTNPLMAGAKRDRKEHVCDIVSLNINPSMAVPNICTLISLNVQAITDEPAYHALFHDMLCIQTIWVCTHNESEVD